MKDTQESRLIYELNCFVDDPTEIVDGKRWFSLPVESPTVDKEEAVELVKNSLTSEDFKGETVYASSYFVDAPSNSNKSECLAFDEYHILN